MAEQQHSLSDVEKVTLINWLQSFKRRLLVRVIPGESALDQNSVIAGTLGFGTTATVLDKIL